MTEEQLKAFLKAEKSDATLRQQLMAASDQEEVAAIASSDAGGSTGWHWQQLNLISKG